MGEWVIPEDTNIIISIKLAHDSEESFPDAASFNPDRYIGAPRKPVAWIPFGGGVNRCVGAAFANMEMDVILRILLRELRFAANRCAGRTRALAWCGDRAGDGAHERWFTGEPTKPSSGADSAIGGRPRQRVTRLAY